MPQLRVGFSPLIGGSLLAAAVFHLYAYTLTEAGLQMVYTLVLGVPGFLYFFGTYLRVERNEIDVKNALGISVKTLQFASAHDLCVDRRTLWVLPTSEREPMKISGLAANGHHWRTLGEAIAEAQAAAPRPSPSVGV